MSTNELVEQLRKRANMIDHEDGSPSCAMSMRAAADTVLALTARNAALVKAMDKVRFVIDNPNERWRIQCFTIIDAALQAAKETK